MPWKPSENDRVAVGQRFREGIIEAVIPPITERLKDEYNARKSKGQVKQSELAASVGYRGQGTVSKQVLQYDGPSRNYTLQIAVVTAIFGHDPDIPNWSNRRAFGLIAALEEVRVLRDELGDDVSILTRPRISRLDFEILRKSHRQDVSWDQHTSDDSAAQTLAKIIRDECDAGEFNEQDNRMLNHLTADYVNDVRRDWGPAWAMLLCNFPILAAD